MTQRKRLTVTIPSIMISRLRDVALRERRTVGGTVEIALEMLFAAMVERSAKNNGRKPEAKR